MSCRFLVSRVFGNFRHLSGSSTKLGCFSATRFGVSQTFDVRSHFSTDFSESILDAPQVTVKKNVHGGGGDGAEHDLKGKRVGMKFGKRFVLSNKFEPIPYSVYSKDPNWMDMSERRKKEFRVANFYRDPTMWPGNKVPVAVETSNFDYQTIRAVQRFPSLGNLGQCNSTKGFRRLDDIKYSNTSEFPQVYHKPFGTSHILKQINYREIGRRRKEVRKNGKEIDWRVSAGDEIELHLFSNLVKKKLSRTSGLVLERRNKGFNSSIIIRTTERDGLIIYRQFPMYSPWIKAIKILKRHKVKRRKISYMYDAPARIKDPVLFGDRIGVHSRKEFFDWMRNSREGVEFARRELLKRRMYFHGARQTRKWMVNTARLNFRLPVIKATRGWFRMQKRKKNLKKWDLRWYHKFNGEPFPRNA